MPNYSYTIFEKPNKQTIFASGENWLIGLTAKKNEELLRRIRPLAESGVLDSGKVEETINDFIVWFRESYFQAQRQECTYDDAEIVESVGILQMDKSGQASIFTFGRFKFDKIKSKQIQALSTNNFHVSDLDLIVADPKNSGVAESILAIEKNQVLTSDTEKYKDFSYSFAVVRVSKRDIKLKRKYIIPILVGLVLSIISIIGWQNQTKIVEMFTKNDTTYVETNLPDTLNQGILTDNANTENIDSLSNRTNETISEAAVQTTEKSADEYFDLAEQSLGFARAFLEDGKNAKALKQLDSALLYYTKYLGIRPEKQKDIQPKLNEIQSKKSLINGNLNL